MSQQHRVQVLQGVSQICERWKEELPIGRLLIAPYAGIWLMITWHLPHPPVPWEALLPVAILFGIGANVLQLFAAYVAGPWLASATGLYGVLGITTVMVAVLLLVGRLIIASAHLNVILWERQRLRQADFRPASLRDAGHQPN